MLNWIVSYRTVFDIETVLTRTVFDIETIVTLNRIVSIRTVLISYAKLNCLN